MKNKLIIKLGLVLFMYLFGLYMHQYLPPKIPVHWNFEGQIDRWGDKDSSVFIIPTIVLIIVIAFHFLPKLDPKKANYEKFEKTWEIFQLVIILFFIYTYVITILASIYQELNVGKLIPFGIGVMFIIMGNYMGKIRQNYFVGIKLPWTLANEEVWNKTHRFGGKAFMLSGIMFIISSFVSINPAILLGGIITFILVAPILYSYIIYKNVGKNK